MLKADFKIILEKQIWLRYHKNKVGKKKTKDFNAVCDRLEK